MLNYGTRLSSLVVLLILSSSAAAVSTQSPDDILPDGSAFLWVEAEDAVELGGGDPADAEAGFILVDNVDPIQTILEEANGEVVKGGLDVLPEDTNASGGAAIFHQLGGSGNARWQTQFEIPATYYLYLHYSFFNRDTNTNYGNEDSIYVPPSFNATARSDWINFEGVDSNGDPKTGDSNRDGWMPLGKDVVSEGDVETHNSTDEDFWDGQFHWGLMDVAVDVDENESFVSDFGHGIEYEITDDATGIVLDYEIATREPYGVIDGLLFSTNNELLLEFSQEQMDEFFLNPGGAVPGDFDGNGVLELPDLDLLNTEIASASGNLAFDLNGDDNLTEDDLNVWVKELRRTWIGDSNLDGEFNSSDLVGVFQAGKFEEDQDATWAEGDWNADLRFGSGDLVKAFQDGGFELGPLAATAPAVPEPSTLLLCLIGLGMLTRCKRPVTPEAA